MVISRVYSRWSGLSLTVLLIEMAALGPGTLLPPYPVPYFPTPTTPSSLPLTGPLLHSVLVLPYFGPSRSVCLSNAVSARPGAGIGQAWLRGELWDCIGIEGYYKVAAVCIIFLRDNTSFHTI